MSKRTVAGLIATPVLGALLLGGCASAPTPSAAATTGGTTTAAVANFQPCAVSDLTGFNDKDFNQLTYEGVKAAAKELGVTAKGAEPASEDQYAGSINAMVNEHCNLIVTVGFALANATRDAAKQAPKVDFALIDSVVTDANNKTIQMDNVKPVLFDTAQAAALAGYLAAGVSKTGKVGVYGGMPFPSVTVFMDGFADGVAHYNEVHHKDVQLLGWNKQTQNGLFVGSFDNQIQARTITDALLDQKADVIMPVAGPLVQASGTAILDRKSDAALIGVNSDQTTAFPKFTSLFLTSVMKNLTTAAHEVTMQAGQGKFSATPYIGTLANDGVGIAPLHDWQSKVDPALWNEVQQLKADIIAGTFTADSISSPKS